MIAGKAVVKRSVASIIAGSEVRILLGGLARR
jgi:hypothetical protein